MRPASVPMNSGPAEGARKKSDADRAGPRRRSCIISSVPACRTRSVDRSRAAVEDRERITGSSSRKCRPVVANGSVAGTELGAPELPRPSTRGATGKRSSSIVPASAVRGVSSNQFTRVRRGPRGETDAVCFRLSIASRSRPARTGESGIQLDVAANRVPLPRCRLKLLDQDRGCSVRPAARSRVRATRWDFRRGQERVAGEVEVAGAVRLQEARVIEGEGIGVKARASPYPARPRSRASRGGRRSRGKDGIAVQAWPEGQREACHARASGWSHPPSHPSVTDPASFRRRACPPRPRSRASR